MPESVGTVTVLVPRFGDLSLRSQGTLTPQPTRPEEASGRFKKNTLVQGVLCSMNKLCIYLLFYSWH